MRAYENQSDLQLAALLDSLGITPDIITRKALPRCFEPQELVVAETDATGREYQMIPPAAQAWWAMKTAAQEEGVVLEIVSAFRNIERQTDIIRAKLAKNVPIDTILTLSAAPGYSEHHTGRAIDINTPGCEATEEPFELTEAFRWLTRRAGEFGFTLSYPRGNKLGFIYEPWHWYFNG